MDAVFQATRGGLRAAATALATAKAPSIGLITGFFVPGGDPPAAETDGPAGAALMALAFRRSGLTCRLATDTICQSACRAALNAAGAAGVAIDSVAPSGEVDDVIACWRQQGINWAIAIERPGPAPDGSPRNMRGADISAFAAPLDQLFTAGPWQTIAIGDGGNELGMGRIPRALIAQHVPSGDAIGCKTPADILITAGVSHWGAYALLAALSQLRSEWSAPLRSVLKPELDQRIVAAMVRDGPAVDGVTLTRAATIDGLDMTHHHQVLSQVTAFLDPR
jgi:D-glutamate cyclase